MTVSHMDVDELILSIHSASLEPDGWNQVGQALLQVFSAHSGIALRAPSHAYPEPWAVLIDFDPSVAAAYAQHWSRYDVWYQDALRTGRIRTGLVSVDTQLTSTEEFESSVFFNDFLKPLDIGRMIQVCLAGSDSDGGFGSGALCLYRGINKAPFSSDDVRLLSALAPHLTVAARNYWISQSLRLLTSLRGNALDALSSAVFALDRSGKVLFANSVGQEWIRQQKWVRVVRGSLAFAATVTDADRLLVKLHRALTGIGSTVLVTDRATGAESQVSISPVPPTIDGGFFGGHPAALVWITPMALRKDTGKDVAMLFGLTPAERRILDRLIAGMDLRDAATELGISIHTARTQLKSILHKTGRRSQSQLLMLAARLATLSTHQSQVPDS